MEDSFSFSLDLSYDLDITKPQPDHPPFWINDAKNVTVSFDNSIGVFCHRQITVSIDRDWICGIKAYWLLLPTIRQELITPTN